MCAGAHQGLGDVSLLGIFKAVGELMGCAQSRELNTRAFAFQGLSCWEASVTLYLWFRLPFVDGLAVLTELLIVTVGTMGSF